MFVYLKTIIYKIIPISYVFTRLVDLLYLTSQNDFIVYRNALFKVNLFLVKHDLMACKGQSVPKMSFIYPNS